MSGRPVNEQVWISGDQQTVNGLLDRRLETDPDGEYLDVCGTKLSAAEVASAANRLANALAAMGLRPGDRVATLVENSAEALLAWWGIVRGGAVAVPVNTAYKGEYLRHQLTDSGSRVLVAESALADRVARISGDMPALDHVIVIGEAVHPPEVTVHTWDDVLGTDDAEPGVAVRPADLATFIYTGGTTGLSKGCMLSHNYHEVLARQIGICWRRTADDVVWTPLPLFHFNAIVTAVLGPLMRPGRRISSGGLRAQLAERTTRTRRPHAVAGRPPGVDVRQRAETAPETRALLRLSSYVAGWSPSHLGGFCISEFSGADIIRPAPLLQLPVCAAADAGAINHFLITYKI